MLCIWSHGITCCPMKWQIHCSSMLLLFVITNKHFPHLDISSSSHSCHLQGQRLGDFLRLALQLQEQKKALNKLVIFDSSVATAWHSPTTSYYLSLLPTVTCQIGSSPGYYSMSVRNLIEFFSRIHSSNLHWLAWDQFYKLIWR